jgi:CO dehydrogenase nickel-insertion accessory protein CooC1
VGSKVRNVDQEKFLKDNLGEIPLIGIIPFSEEIARADLENRPPSLDDPEIFRAIEKIASAIQN